MGRRLTLLLILRNNANQYACSLKCSLQTALFNYHVFAHYEAMSGHLAKFGQHATYVLIGIDEGDHNGQITTSLNKMSRTQFASAEKPGNGMERHGSCDILFAQEPQNFQMQGPVMPGIAFGEVDGDLYGHMVRHFISIAPARHPPARPRGTARCWQ